MISQFQNGSEVRVIRNIRNDGTFPGKERGDLLVRRGSVGYVRDIGTFLQDQIVYTVHFMDQDYVVGCREPELIDARDEWVPSEFESREKVSAKIPLAIKGEIIVKQGDIGEIIRVVRDQADGVSYEVNFPGRMLLVPETALLSTGEAPVYEDEDLVEETEE
jgi:hypothetical protein